MPAVTEAEFLEACPRRGPAWECYRDAKKAGAEVMLIVDAHEVIALRCKPGFGIKLTPKVRKNAKTHPQQSDHS